MYCRYAASLSGLTNHVFTDVGVMDGVAKSATELAKTGNNPKGNNLFAVKKFTRYGATAEQITLFCQPHGIE